MKHALTKAMKEKGYKAKEVASRWGLQPHSLALASKNPKQIHWDAVAGLPDKRLTSSRGDGFTAVKDK